MNTDVQSAARAALAPEEAAPEAPPAVEPELVQRQRLLLRELLHLVEERAEREPRLDTEWQARVQAEVSDFDSKYQQIIIRFAADKETVEQELREVRQQLTQGYTAERAAAERAFVEARARSLEQYEEAKEAVKAEYQEAHWTITAVSEGGKGSLERRSREGQQCVTAAAEHIREVRQEAREYLQACRLDGAYPREPLRESPAAADPFEDLQELLAAADRQLLALKSLALPRYFKGERLVFLCVGLGLVSLLPTIWLLGVLGGLAVSTLGTLAGGVAGRFWLYSAGRRQVGRVYGPLLEALAEAEGLLKRCQEETKTAYHRTLAENQRRYRREIRQAAATYHRRRAELKQRRAEELAREAATYRQRRAALKEQRTAAWRAAVDRYRRRRTEIQQQFERDAREAQERHERRLADSQASHERAWNALCSTWHQGLARARAEIAAIQAESSRLFPAWSDPAWTAWTPPAAVPPVIRFGAYRVDLAGVPGGLPWHPRLASGGPTAFALPALLPFAPACSWLLRVGEAGRAEAVQALQAVMFRLLTALPPGKVRFTILDPVGLGQNFASFMHLADYDEALVTSRIWTEAPRLEQRLADLTEHMENVIQKYLRNQFATLEEYNAQAGEVAEPYRILVVADFPANFTSEAARRLVSILHSGPRCGVYTLLSVDTRQPLPPGFDLADLEQAAVNLVWEDGGFAWEDPDFAPFPLELDGPPLEELGTRLLHQVGARARDARRVEVPFEFVAPPPERWWTGDSRLGIHVPLGRVGATKRQFLDLGHGTAQHVLIAGKTGSGKSTLLHALISNLALLYSPDEVELYLVDFKKGVEFKTYAAHELPHARVVAIESEREFGLSVLQRLDAELRQRGERFRAVAAQDLAAYRQATGDTPLPRILLIVDEFQEFFVEDDKIAQEAALLLDRLVRQGRAFGLHVLLGSQTLGGAYTLARSTIDQMAVRIALQCSEADGHLILSEDNAAARLLSRPGEAIYNDANGRVEGNNPFQVVWLAEDRREHYLQRLGELARQRGSAPAEQVVFEGNAPADIRRNHLLNELLRAPAWPAQPRAVRAWLGEAIAIKDPTAAVFRAQGGSNLLILGQNDEAALGMLTTALVSLAAQEASSRFTVLDGSADDAPYAGLLARLAERLPQAVQVAGWREVPRLMAELAAEVERRQTAPAAEAPPVYLVVFGLQRFRDLRRAEEDFSFGRPGEPAGAAQQFANLLRDGPAVGVHALVWSDSLNTLNRTVERQGLREFELRVLFQMSALDSSNLIDTPLASKLGLHRALFHSEEQGRLEKFRPYGLPSEEWLKGVEQQLRQKPVGEPAPGR